MPSSSPIRSVRRGTTKTLAVRVSDAAGFRHNPADPPTAQEHVMTATMTRTEKPPPATLYFGPWSRRSPFFEKTLEAGCSAYDIYNHMYLPGYFADPIDEYWALLNEVTVWDVAVERIVEITGPDAPAL